MPSQFEQQLGSANLSQPLELPLVHTTTFEVSLQILQTGKFDCPSPCPVYAEDLVYTFVARPVYRFPDGANPILGMAFAPVCFLMKPHCAGGAVRALPFDSGGFDRYKDQMHPSWERANFEMHPVPGRAEQVLQYFWPDKAAYYEGRPRPGLAIAAVKTLLQQYYTLITNGVTHGFDSRCSTIEVQLPSPFDLAGNLCAVVAPARAAEDKEYQRLVKKSGADLIGYKFHEPFYANDYFTPIFDAVELYLRQPKLS